VAEALGHRGDGDSCREHLGGHEVAEIVQPEVRQARGTPGGDEPLRQSVGQPRLPAVRTRAEHERACRQLRADLPGSPRRQVSVRRQHAERLGVEFDPVGAVGLGGAELGSVWPLDQRASEGDRGSLNIDVAPPQGEQLTPTGHRSRPRAAGSRGVAGPGASPTRAGRRLAPRSAGGSRPVPFAAATCSKQGSARSSPSGGPERAPDGALHGPGPRFLGRGSVVPALPAGDARRSHRYPRWSAWPGRGGRGAASGGTRRSTACGSRWRRTTREMPPRASGRAGQPMCRTGSVPGRLDDQVLELVSGKRWVPWTVLLSHRGRPVAGSAPR
jgi:hypothetical protein